MGTIKDYRACVELRRKLTRKLRSLPSDDKDSHNKGASLLLKTGLELILKETVHQGDDLAIEIKRQMSQHDESLESKDSSSESKLDWKPKEMSYSLRPDLARKIQLGMCRSLSLKMDELEGRMDEFKHTVAGVTKF